MICQACGVEAPTKYVEFHQNIGAFLVRFPRSIKGKLCKSCIHKYFWSYTSTTFLMGWWGSISLIVTPFYILNNVGRYLGCVTMKPVPPEAQPPRLDADVMMSLQRHADEILKRLTEGEKLEVIAADVGPRAGVTPGQVVLYTINLIETLKQQG